MEWKSIGEIGSAILIVGTTMFMLLRYIKEKKAQRVGLQPNPKRCVEQDARIKALEICSEKTSVEITAIKEDVQDIKADVKTLLGLHLKN